MGVYRFYDNRNPNCYQLKSMKQTEKQRRQISQFSEWLAIRENEKLIESSRSPIIPHLVILICSSVPTERAKSLMCVRTFFKLGIVTGPRLYVHMQCLH